VYLLINICPLGPVHRRNSKVGLLQVDERLQSPGGTVAVLHTEPTERRVVVGLLGSLLYPVVPDVLLELVVLAHSDQEEQPKHDTEADQDHLAGVAIGPPVHPLLQLDG